MLRAGFGMGFQPAYFGGTPPPTPSPVSISGTPDPGSTATTYSFTPTTANGSGTKTFSFIGTDSPSFLGGTFNTSTGAITGPFTWGGKITGNIRVTDSSGTADLPIDVTIVGVTHPTTWVPLDGSNVGTATVDTATATLTFRGASGTLRRGVRVPIQCIVGEDAQITFAPTVAAASFQLGSTVTGTDPTAQSQDIKAVSNYVSGTTFRVEFTPTTALTYAFFSRTSTGSNTVIVAPTAERWRVLPSFTDRTTPIPLVSRFTVPIGQWTPDSGQGGPDTGLALHPDGSWFVAIGHGTLSRKSGLMKLDASDNFIFHVTADDWGLPAGNYSAQGTCVDLIDLHNVTVMKQPGGTTLFVKSNKDTGAFIQSWAAVTDGMNAIAFDANRNQFPTMTDGGTVRWYDRDFRPTGKTFGPVGLFAPDQIFHDAYWDDLHITGGSNGTNGRIWTYNTGSPYDGCYLDEARAMEGMVRLDNTVRGANDGHTHSTAGFPELNQLLLYNGVWTGTKAVRLAGFTPLKPPRCTVKPAITGTPTVGSVLTCSQGTWVNGETYAYTWHLDGSTSAISGANASTYTVQAGDAGHTIRCMVRASNVRTTSTWENSQEVSLS